MNDQVKQSLKRTLVGKVVSDKMDKTVTVLVERRVKHPLYGKIVMRSNKYHAHDESNQVKEGDTVEIQEGRPISKTKAWTVTRVVQEAQIV
jgi:small subunit ribosomal protein S17